MGRLIVLVSNIMLVIWFCMPVTGYAGVKEEYQEAYKTYVAAAACLAAYSDRIGKLSYEYLEQEGWEIQPYIQTGTKVDARFLLAKKTIANSSQPMYLLAVVGTETIKDIKTDLRVDKVYFAGHTLEEFERDAQREMPDTFPKVHRGFNQYVQAALTAQTKETEDAPSKLLSELLLDNKERKVYLVGHSLGGAAATLGGARLLSMGVQPKQIEVITFGAPAVGNEAFSRQVEPLLPLTRVVTSGDPVTGVLQKLVGGYQQFGREIRWEQSDTNEDQPHQMVDYLDLAIKNYYQKRQQALQAGIIELPLQTIDIENKDRVYVAPVQNHLPGKLEQEFWYMQQALMDEYRKGLPGYFFADAAVDNRVWRKQAVEQNCKLLVIPEIHGYRVKNEQNAYYIVFQQTVYEAATGHVVSMAEFSTGTYHITTLEALIHDAKLMKRDISNWLSNEPI